MLEHMMFKGTKKYGPEDYSRIIQSVSREDVLRVARKYLQPENCILVVVANQKMADIE